MNVVATRGKNGNWRWRIVDSDHRIVAMPPIAESYDTQAQAIGAGRQAMKRIAQAAEGPAESNRPYRTPSAATLAFVFIAGALLGLAVGALVF